MDSLTIPTQLANAVLGYLGSRPYQEVYQLIAALQEAAKQSLPEEIAGGAD